MRKDAPTSQTVFAWIMRRPALVAAVLFACGIALHDALPFSPRIALATTVGLLGLSVWLRRDDCSCAFFLAIALVLSGATAGQLAASAFPRNHIANFVSDERRLATIELELTDSPRLVSTDGPRHGNGRQVGRAIVDRIKTINGWEKSSGEVTFSYALPDPPLLAGQRLRVVAMLQSPAQASNPGEFDWRKQYRRQRVMAAVHVTRACELQILNSTPASANLGLRDRARQWLRAGFSPAQRIDRELLVALVFGDRGPDVQKIEDDFNTTGATHLLASSGLRVGMLTSCLYLLCRLLRLRPRASLVVVTIAVAALGAVMLPSAQAMRPVLACGAVAAALWTRRPVDAIQVLGLGALTLLVLRPLDLYSAGFQMTFVVVLGLLVLTPPLVRWAEGKLSDPDIDVLAKFGRLSRCQRIWRWCWRRVIELTAVGLVAWIVSLPLVAYHFEQVNLWSVPVGLVLLPVTLLALVLGFVKIALTALLPWGAPLWATLASLPASCLRHGIAWCAHLPWADVPTPSPSPTRILLFYLLLGAVCAILWLPSARLRFRWFAGCGLAGACGMSLFLPVLVGFSGQSTPAGEVRITLLSVGAGQCAAAELPDGKLVLFDAGSSALSDPLRTVIGPFLRHEGRSAVDSIYLSHGDFDHISAAGSIFSRYGVHDVIASPFLQKHSVESSTCRRLLATLNGAHHPPSLITAGQHTELGGGASVDVLWPPRNCTFNSNNAGVVLRLSFAGRSVLFPADIQAPTESELLKHPSSLKADILVAPHHGSSEFTTAAFVAAINPKVIVSSDDHRLTNKQRTFEQVIGNRPLYRTGHCGAITIVIDRKGNIRVEPFLSRAAGAIVIARN